jgi:hypothetical protein
MNDMIPLAFHSNSFLFRLQPFLNSLLLQSVNTFVRYFFIYKQSSNPVLKYVPIIDFNSPLK